MTLLAAYGMALTIALLASGVRVTQEDGYYYFQIARNLAAGRGLTFDGVHLTNGYHPLWLVALVVVYRFVTGTQTALVIGSLIQGALLAASTAVVFAMARLTAARLAAATAALLWVQLTFQQSLSGLEFGLHAFLLLSICYYWLRWSHNGSLTVPRCLVLGGLLSAAFLARLDTVMLAGIVGLTLLGQMARERGQDRIRLMHVIALAGPVLLTVLAYEEVNRAVFGHPSPVSGFIKRDWSVFLMSQDPVYRDHGFIIAKAWQLLRPFTRLEGTLMLSLLAGALVVPVVTGMAYVVPRNWRWFEPIRAWAKPWHPILVYSFLSYVAINLFLHSDLSLAPWYYVIQPMLTSLVVGVILESVCRRWTAGRTESTTRRIWTVAGVLVLTIPLWTTRIVYAWCAASRSGSVRDPLHDASIWARDHLPPDAVIGAWNAGNIGYFSNRRTVNLDGLVNSWDYALHDREELCRYWRSAGITHLVDVFESEQALSRIPTLPFYAGCTDRLRLIWSDDRYHASWRVEVYRLGEPSR